MRLGRIARHLALYAATLLVGGFLGAALLRFGPGFESDERDVDSRYSAQTLEAIHKERASERNLFVFYWHYLRNAAHGDLGVSRSLETPVSTLIAQRAGVTVRLAASGLAIGWAVGLALALLAAMWRNALFRAFAEMLGGVALSLPAAVVALLVFLANGPVSLVIALAIFPQVFRYARDLFERALAQPQVLAARARGIPGSWILLRYVARPSFAPLVALAGVCVSLAFGAAIPVEAICDVPGIGQLAWKAALGRDLPLLVSLTLVVTAVTLAANGVADIALSRSGDAA